MCNEEKTTNRLLYLPHLREGLPLARY